jgi:hypothetical protein
VRDLARRLGAGDRQNLGEGLGRERCLAGRAGLVPQQALDALLGKALLPAPNRRTTHARTLGHLQHGQALAGVEDDARPLHVLLRAVAVGDDRGQAFAITAREDHARGLGHASDSHASHLL